jgi:hypothetical protein
MKTLVITIFMVFSLSAIAAPPTKSKFYDFGDQVIDGEIKTPQFLYMDARLKAKFDRLLKLKKSFLPRLYITSKEKVFK